MWVVWGAGDTEVFVGAEAWPRLEEEEITQGRDQRAAHVLEAPVVHEGVQSVKALALEEGIAEARLRHMYAPPLRSATSKLIHEAPDESDHKQAHAAEPRIPVPGSIRSVTRCARMWGGWDERADVIRSLTHIAVPLDGEQEAGYISAELRFAHSERARAPVQVLAHPRERL